MRERRRRVGSQIKIKLLGLSLSQAEACSDTPYARLQNINTALIHFTAATTRSTRTAPYRARCVSHMPFLLHLHPISTDAHISIHSFSSLRILLPLRLRDVPSVRFSCTEQEPRRTEPISTLLAWTLSATSLPAYARITPKLNNPLIIGSVPLPFLETAVDLWKLRYRSLLKSSDCGVLFHPASPPLTSVSELLCSWC
jgi:hypothetical protein